MRARIFATLLPCLVACFVFPAALAALPWSLASCDASGEPRWHAFEQEVRASTPGGTLYVPKPYPTADRQVIADFLYHFRVLHKAKNSDRLAALPLPSDGRVVESIESERVSYRVTRVENWTQMRCGWHHKQDFYYIVQVFEVATGEEITRAALDYSGLFVTSINMPASVPGPVEPSARRLLPAPATAMNEINREFGLQGVDPDTSQRSGRWIATSRSPVSPSTRTACPTWFTIMSCSRCRRRGPSSCAARTWGRWRRTRSCFRR